MHIIIRCLDLYCGCHGCFQGLLLTTTTVGLPSLVTPEASLYCIILKIPPLQILFDVVAFSFSTVCCKKGRNIVRKLPDHHHHPVEEERQRWPRVQCLRAVLQAPQCKWDGHSLTNVSGVKLNQSLETNFCQIEEANAMPDYWADEYWTHLGSRAVTPHNWCPCVCPAITLNICPSCWACLASSCVKSPWVSRAF